MTDTDGHRAKIRILLLDEQPLLRYGISAYLNSQPDMVVCGEAESVPDAGSKIAECQPQVLVMELGLGVGAGDSLKLLKKLKTKKRALRILVYSAFEESIFAERAMRAGAAGYVMKRSPTEELAAAIRDIAKDGIYVSREVALSGFRKSLQLLPKNNRSPRSTNALENLSDREMHVFQLLGSGLGTRQIAQSLDLSVKTIESHRENIKHKLRLSSGAQLRERAAKWVKETSGVRRPRKLRIHGFRERKPSHWTCSRRPVGDAHASHSEAATTLHRRHQQQPPSGSDPAVSGHVLEPTGVVPVISEA
jgi:DNA-binding NarL/FixJ family response regulator